MSSPKVWSGVGVAVQSAIAATKTISAITKANPAVVTSTAHGYLAGDRVSLLILGMSQLNNRALRVANVTANTFELEGIDSTLYDTFTSGTAQLLTMGLTMSTIIGLTASGGDFSFVKTTTIHDTVESQIPGIAAAGVYSMQSIWDVSDASLIALNRASDNKSKLAIQFAFPDGQKALFNGYVGCSLIPGGSAQALVETPVVLTMFGRPAYYAT